MAVAWLGGECSLVVHCWKFQVDSLELDALLKLDSVWHSFSQDSY